MPMYEYYCRECSTHIETLRRADDRDAPVTCPTNATHRPKRMLSVFATRTAGSREYAGSRDQSSGGGCACGGNCACRN